MAVKMKKTCFKVSPLTRRERQYGKGSMLPKPASSRSQRGNTRKSTSGDIGSAHPDFPPNRDLGLTRSKLTGNHHKAAATAPAILSHSRGFVCLSRTDADRQNSLAGHVSCTSLLSFIASAVWCGHLSTPSDRLRVHDAHRVQSGRSVGRKR